eukprot:2209816-Amphidinium_carterae.1
MSYKRQTRHDSQKHPPSQQEQNRAVLRRKVRFLCAQFDIEERHIVNIDETMVRFLPEADCGWGEKGSSSSGNPKKMTTATLAVSHSGKIAEITVLFEGTGRVMPVGPLPDGVHVDVGPSNWQSNASLMKLVGSLDIRIQEDHDPVKHGEKKVHWLLLLDLAPVHCSAESMEALRSNLPWVHACFVPPHSTSYCQPADVAYMRPLKAAITR